MLTFLHQGITAAPETHCLPSWLPSWLGTEWAAVVCALSQQWPSKGQREGGKEPPGERLRKGSCCWDFVGLQALPQNLGRGGLGPAWPITLERGD